MCVPTLAFPRSISVLTRHGRQLCRHVALRANLLPGGCGKVKPPELPEEGVVLVL